MRCCYDCAPPGITLNDLLHYFQQETGVEEDVDLMEIQEMFQEAKKTSEVDGCNREDVTQLSCLTEDDGVFRATMRTLLRRQSVDNVDLDTVADERWKSFAGFERKVEEETVMKGGEGVVDDILPGNSQLAPVIFQILPSLPFHKFAIANRGRYNPHSIKYKI